MNTKAKRAVHKQLSYSRSKVEIIVVGPLIYIVNGTHVVQD